jgi:hypothetical protein
VEDSLLFILKNRFFSKNNDEAGYLEEIKQKPIITKNIVLKEKRNKL